jgi:hypothetical protein
MRAAAVAIYVAVIVGGIVAVNENAENGRTAFVAWAVASLLIGWIARHPLAILLPLLAIPIAVPFGSANEWLGSDAPSIPVGMAFEAPLQVVSSLLASARDCSMSASSAEIEGVRPFRDMEIRSRG